MGYCKLWTMIAYIVALYANYLSILDLQCSITVYLSVVDGDMMGK